MDLPADLLIIVGIVIVLLGIFAGMLLSTLKEDVEPEESSGDQAPPGGRKGRYTPIVRFWRERGTGALVVEMDGKSFISPEPLSASQREQLEHTARDLRTWLGMGIVSTLPDEAQPAPDRPATAAAAGAAAPAPDSPSPAAAAPTPAVPAPAAAPASYAAVYPAPDAAVPPAVPYTPSEPLRPISRTVEPIRLEPVPAVVTNKSIVMQIEDILQDMIAGTPLARRGLHLLEDPKRGVLVQVGTSLFEGIDSVPEPDVQATLRAAVQEWENSQ